MAQNYMRCYRELIKQSAQGDNTASAQLPFELAL